MGVPLCPLWAAGQPLASEAPVALTIIAGWGAKLRGGVQTAGWGGVGFFTLVSQLPGTYTPTSGPRALLPASGPLCTL